MAANKTFWWDAPKGYKAVKSSIYCDGCSFQKGCIDCPCTPSKRKDKQFVIFIKRENHVQWKEGF